MVREGVIAAAVWVIASVALLSTSPALAHGGGLDKYGCHHDRKHGGYHCHRGSSAAAPIDDTASRTDLSPRIQPRASPQTSPSRPFANCAEARAAGAAPVRRGDPGMGRILIAMGMEWGANRAADDTGLIPTECRYPCHLR